MDLFLIVVGMISEFFGVLLLIRHSDGIIKYLIKNPITYPTDKPVGKVKNLLDNAKRKTQGGIILFIVGFFLQIVGLAGEQIISLQNLKG